MLMLFRTFQPPIMLLVAFSIVACFSLRGNATVVYLSEQGSDTATCTQPEAPCRSLATAFAIAVASQPSALLLQPGIYPLTNLLQSETPLNITSTIPGAKATISSSGLGGVVLGPSTPTNGASVQFTLRDLSFEGGVAPPCPFGPTGVEIVGCGVISVRFSALDITSCSFTGSKGRAIGIANSIATVSNCAFTQNMGMHAPAFGFYNVPPTVSALTISDTVFAENYAGDFDPSSTNISVAFGGAAGIFFASQTEKITGTILIQRSTFKNNHCGVAKGKAIGGALYIVAASSDLNTFDITMMSNTFSSNSAKTRLLLDGITSTINDIRGTAMVLSVQGGVTRFNFRFDGVVSDNRGYTAGIHALSFGALFMDATTVSRWIDSTINIGGTFTDNSLTLVDGGCLGLLPVSLMSGAALTIMMSISAQNVPTISGSSLTITADFEDNTCRGTLQGISFCGTAAGRGGAVAVTTMMPVLITGNFQRNVVSVTSNAAAKGKFLVAPVNGGAMYLGASADSVEITVTVISSFIDNLGVGSSCGGAAIDIEVFSAFDLQGLEDHWKYTIMVNGTNTGNVAIATGAPTDKDRALLSTISNAPVDFMIAGTGGCVNSVGSAPGVVVYHFHGLRCLGNSAHGAMVSWGGAVFIGNGGGPDALIIDMDHGYFYNNTAIVTTPQGQSGGRSVGGAFFFGYGGSSSILRESSLTFHNCQFIDNNCVVDGVQGKAYGGGMTITYLDLPAGGTVTIGDTIMKGNRAVASFAVGGGANLMTTESLIRAPVTPQQFRGNVSSWPQIIEQNVEYEVLKLHNVSIEDNYASSAGGGLWCQDFNISVYDFVFSNNTAGAVGGAMYVSGSPDLLLQSGRFVGSRSLRRRASELFSSTSGRVSLRSTTFDLETPFPGTRNNSESFEWLDVRNAIFFQNGIEVADCPRGYFAESQTFTQVLNPPVVPTIPLNQGAFSKEQNTRLSHAASLSCAPCPGSWYSLVRGPPTSNQSQCNPCAGGGICYGANEIYGYAGFYGDVADDNSSVTFVRCADTACCPTEAAPCRYDSPCVGNRSGVMCGKCPDGMSISFAGQNCIENKYCNNGNWFMTVIFVAVVVFVLFNVIKSSRLMFRLRGVWVSMSDKVSTLKYRDIFRDAHRLTGSSDHIGGVIKSVSYFYQVAPIAMTALDVELMGDGYRVISGIFGLEINIGGSSGTSRTDTSACMFPNVKLVHRVAANYVVPLMMFFVVAVCMLVQKALAKRAVSWATQRRGSIVSLPSQSKGSDIEVACWCALFTSLSLAYSTALKTTFQLLHCVHVAGAVRCFNAPEVICWTWWQILLFLTVLPMLLSFPLLLAYFVRRQMNRAASSQVSARGGAAVLIYTLAFKDTQIGHLWESVLMGRRLVLITIWTFMDATSTRAWVITLCNIVVFVGNLAAQPWNQLRLHVLDTTALAILVLLSARSIVTATFEQYGIVPSSASSTSRGFAGLSLFVFLVPMIWGIILVGIHVFGNKIKRAVNKKWDHTDRFAKLGLGRIFGIVHRRHGALDRRPVSGSISAQDGIELVAASSECCSVCGESTAIGEAVIFIRGVGMLHRRCALDDITEDVNEPIENYETGQDASSNVRQIDADDHQRVPSTTDITIDQV